METLKNYLTQKSTYIGILKIAAAIGLFNVVPDLENQIADTAVLVAEAALAVIGVYFVVKNDKKDA